MKAFSASNINRTCKILIKRIHSLFMPLTSGKSIKIYLEEFTIRVLTLDYFSIRHVLRKEFITHSEGAILDIGSGTGLLCTYFPSTQYIGIDINSDLIEYAKQLHPGYRFLRMDAGHLTLKKNSFSAALFVGALHHIGEKTFKHMCKKLVKVLKKNSRVLAIEPIPSHWFNFLGRMLRAHDKGHHILGFEDYKKRLNKYFRVEKAYKKNGGLIDYGIFVLRKKRS